jgi:toxin ParE1/3/4
MKIIWTKPAVQDIESIKAYIARDSEYYALRFVDKIIKSIDGLKEFPHRGRSVQEVDDKNVKELLFQNYRIIYRTELKQIQILTIIHGSRDLSTKKPKPWNII